MPVGAAAIIGAMKPYFPRSIGVISINTMARAGAGIQGAPTESPIYDLQLKISAGLHGFPYSQSQWRTYLPSTSSVPCAF